MMPAASPTDELCANIPGPTCGGIGRSLDDDNAEGYVHIHRGIHGSNPSGNFVSDLAADVFDWRNPVAKITITRIRGNDHDDDDDDDDDGDDD